MRVMAVLGLEADINALAADDKVGRKLRDLAYDRGQITNRQPDFRYQSQKPSQ